MTGTSAAGPRVNLQDGLAVGGFVGITTGVATTTGVAGGNLRFQSGTGALDILRSSARAGRQVGMVSGLVAGQAAGLRDMASRDSGSTIGNYAALGAISGANVYLLGGVIDPSRFRSQRLQGAGIAAAGLLAGAGALTGVLVNRGADNAGIQPTPGQEGLQPCLPQ